MDHPNIQTFPVVSESIEAVGHQGTTLAVRFPCGLYHYAGVPVEKYEALLKAKSIGRALNAIKAEHNCTVIK